MTYYQDGDQEIIEMHKTLKRCGSIAQRKRSATSIRYNTHTNFLINDYTGDHDAWLGREWIG